MPKLDKKLPAPKAKQAAPAVDKPLVYPELRVVMAFGDKALCEKDVTELLGWETEADTLARMIKEAEAGGKKPPKEVSFGKSQGSDAVTEWLLKDEDGAKVRCYRNIGNRPFDEATARKLAQEYLNGCWAGPASMPGETVNGETVIVGRHANLLSAQHRLVGYKLACQLWRKGGAKHRERWPDEPPPLETLLVLGVSEDPRVVRTLDNVRVRTEADVFYTMGFFKDKDSRERNEMTRMLAKAVDLLWKRLGIGAPEGSGKVYQTHSESLEFLNRHKRLYSCLEHVFGENKERAVSNAGLSPGQSAACMYLMAAGATDGDAYCATVPRSEKEIDFALWDKAVSFWTELAGNRTSSAKAIRAALAKLVDEEGGRSSEKVAVLALAWDAYKTGAKVTEDAMALERIEDANGKWHIKEWPSFDGIDLGQQVKPEAGVDDPEVTEEDVAKGKEAERQRIAQEALASVEKAKADKAGKSKPAEAVALRPDESAQRGKLLAARNGQSEGMAGELERLWDAHPDTLLLMKGPTTVKAWGKDADEVARVLKFRSTVKQFDMTVAQFPLKDMDANVAKLLKAGVKVAVCEQVGKETKVVPVVNSSPSAPASKPAPAKK